MGGSRALCSICPRQCRPPHQLRRPSHVVSNTAAGAKRLSLIRGAISLMNNLSARSENSAGIGPVRNRTITPPMPVLSSW